MKKCAHLFLYFIFFIFNIGNINVAYCQNLNFKLVDTFNTDINSEVVAFYQIVTCATDSVIYYFDQNEPQKNGGKYLTLHSVNCNSKQRNAIRLDDAGDDIDIFKTSFLLVTDEYIIISFRDNNIVFFNKKGKFVKRLKKEKGNFDFVYLKQVNRLVLIDYYPYQILSQKPMLYLVTINLSDLKIEYKKEYFHESIQFHHEHSKFHASDNEFFYIAEPLSNRIYKYDYALKRVDSFFIKPLCDYSIKLNEKLCNITRQVCKEDDSLKAMKKDSAEMWKFFLNDKRQLPSATFGLLATQDTLMDRIRNINVINNKMYVTKKMKGHFAEDKQLEIDVIDLGSKKILFQGIPYDGNRKNAQTKDDYFKYGLHGSLSMQTLTIGGKSYVYSLYPNNFFPDKMTSRADYNQQFDKWMLNNTPHYMIMLYEIQN